MSDEGGLGQLIQNFSGDTTALDNDLQSGVITLEEAQGYYKNTKSRTIAAL